MYKSVFKRLIDFILSLFAVAALSPILLILIIVGTIEMQGNPFFTQMRPGKKDITGNEVIFKLLKFRSMTNKKDKDGNLLSDEERLTKYGRFIRKTSLDELPELINILKGDMSIVGPRPWFVEYLPYYTEEEHHRHDVRPGLTGWAQVSGRSFLSWEDRIKCDLYYVENCSFFFDIKIVMKTAFQVLDRKNVRMGKDNKFGRFDVARKKELAMKADEKGQTNA